jgi:DNA-binding transcriptional LysR family regulator
MHIPKRYRHIDMENLSFLVTLYEERSVTVAAKKLGISQPAFSKALGKLRDVLGDELFVKSGTGMVPTPRANNLIQAVREVVLRLSREVLSEPQFDPATSHAMFTFALTELGETFCFPTIVNALQIVAPQVRVRSVCPPERELLQGLESGEIDVALGFFPELNSNSFFQQRLVNFGAVCLLRSDHPLAGNALSKSQYLNLGHVTVLAPRGGGAALQYWLRRQRWNLKIEVTTSNFSSIPQLLQTSDLAATVWEPPATNFCRSNDNLKMMKLPFDVKLDFVQHWHARYQNDQKNRWIRNLTKLLFRSREDLLIHNLARTVAAGLQLLQEETGKTQPQG